jgi:hypothetical protein
MTVELAEADLGNGLAAIAAGLDEVLAAGLDPVDSTDAIGLIQQLETLGRRLDAARVDLVEVIDRKGLHRADGHHSAKVMVRHAAKLSGAEAAARARTAKALRDLPATREAFGAGEVGACQVRRMALAHANGRVRDRLPEFEAPLLRIARSESYKLFDEVVTDWVRLADEDGTCEVNQRNHDNRDARLHRDFDQSWELTAGCGSLSGAELKTIFDHFVAAEFRTDWDKARIDHGDATTKTHLDRTDAQRRFDALFAIFEQTDDDQDRDRGSPVYPTSRTRPSMTRAAPRPVASQTRSTTQFVLSHASPRPMVASARFPATTMVPTSTETSEVATAM